VPAPIDEALQTVLQKIITRLIKPLTRKGALVEEQVQTYLANNHSGSDEARELRPLQASACPDRIAFGLRLQAIAVRRYPGQQRSMPPYARGRR